MQSNDAQTTGLLKAKTDHEPSVLAQGHWLTLSSIFFVHGSVGLFGSGLPIKF
jgi:hypothetical protein